MEKAFSIRFSFFALFKEFLIDIAINLSSVSKKIIRNLLDYNFLELCFFKLDTKVPSKMSKVIVFVFKTCVQRDLTKNNKRNCNFYDLGLNR